jgi:hypothetical protein
VAPVKITGKQPLTRKDNNTTVIKGTFCIKIIIKSMTTRALYKRNIFNQ